MKNKQLDNVVKALLKKYEEEIVEGKFDGTLNDYAIQKYPRIYDRIQKTYGGTTK